MVYDEKTCVICCKEFATIKEHNEHYKQCAEKNLKVDYTEEEAFEIIYNEDHF